MTHRLVPKFSLIVHAISVVSWGIAHSVLSIYIVLRHCDELIGGFTNWSSIDINVALHLSSVISYCGYLPFIFLHFLSITSATSSIRVVLLRSSFSSSFFSSFPHGVPSNRQYQRGDEWWCEQWWSSAWSSRPVAFSCRAVHRTVRRQALWEPF